MNGHKMDSWQEGIFKMTTVSSLLSLRPWYTYLSSAIINFSFVILNIWNKLYTDGHVESWVRWYIYIESCLEGKIAARFRNFLVPFLFQSLIGDGHSATRTYGVFHEERTFLASVVCNFIASKFPANTYHSRWCPGPFCRSAISSHGIGNVE